MVDSGNQISSGYVDFYNVYKSLVDTALARPAQAEIQAYWWRTGNRAQFYARVENLSSVTLSSSNSATVHAIVYEDAHIMETDRFARAAVATGISNLAPNASATFTLETSDLVDVNWEKLHFIVLVDYRPSGATGNYDTLQAAIAQPVAGPFVALPETVTFLVDPNDLSMPTASITLIGPASETWLAVPNAPWLTVTPTSGLISTQPTISVIKSQLSTGWQQGSITFANSEGDLSDQVFVNTYLGPISRLYLPIAGR